MSDPIRQFRCKRCGLNIVANDETLTVAHQAPECEWFTALVEQQGGSAGRVVVIDEDTGKEVKVSR